MKLSRTQIVAALRRHMGIVAMAAKELGISRQALGQRIRRSAALKEALRDIEQTCVDAAEGTLLHLVLVVKDPASVRFYMERKGKDRGYAARTEVTGKDGGTVNVETIIEGLSDEQANLVQRLVEAGKPLPPKS